MLSLFFNTESILYATFSEIDFMDLIWRNKAIAQVLIFILLISIVQNSKTFLMNQ